jgi:hypothetical protein
MCSLRFENNLLTIEGVCFASISKKTPLSKLSFAFVSLALPLLVVAFDRSPFQLFTLFLNKSMQAPSSERPINTQWTLFLSFEINNCFQKMKKCQSASLRHTCHIIHLAETAVLYCTRISSAIFEKTVRIGSPS